MNDFPEDAEVSYNTIGRLVVNDPEGLWDSTEELMKLLLKRCQLGKSYQL